ncbi:putative ABC transporter permease [Defluviitalea phaphyphila]|uniref:putative ABC transporter permease n=1 Tax=Defluviitalea phaphyphila TaxID=1473580 RepID=UPI000731035E|nr:putative ABC transporter permease [Defluviitalea phaphyphila]
MEKYFFDIIIYFALYSFIGWVIETIYNSIKKKEFVNRGFLSGPFCPIYGFGAILIIQVFAVFNNSFSIVSNNIFIQIFVAMILTTILEYITGYILEKMFNCKWWDYSDFFLNLHGRVCLQYSIYWGILSYILINLIHPIIIKYVSFLNISIKMFINVFIILYFIFDTIKSVTEIIDLRKIVLRQYKKPLENFYGQIIQYKRIFQAFPKLKFKKIGKLNQEIREYLQNEFKKIKIKVKEKVR